MLFLMALVFVMLILLVYNFVRLIEAHWQSHEDIDVISARRRHRGEHSPRTRALCTLLHATLPMHGRWRR